MVSCWPVTLGDTSCRQAFVEWVGGFWAYILTSSQLSYLICKFVLQDHQQFCVKMQGTVTSSCWLHQNRFSRLLRRWAASCWWHAQFPVGESSNAFPLGNPMEPRSKSRGGLFAFSGFRTGREKSSIQSLWMPDVAYASSQLIIPQILLGRFHWQISESLGN